MAVAPDVQSSSNWEEGWESITVFLYSAANQSAYSNASESVPFATASYSAKAPLAANSLSRASDVYHRLCIR